MSELIDFIKAIFTAIIACVASVVIIAIGYWLVVFCVLLATFITAPAHAETELLFGGYTYHFEKPDHLVDEYNTQTSLIGLKYKNVSVVTYKNSYFKQSYGLYGQVGGEPHKNIGLYLVGGVVSGYEGTDLAMWGNVSPVLYVKLDLHPDSNKWGTVLAISPTHFVSINFKVKL